MLDGSGTGDLRLVGKRGPGSEWIKRLAPELRAEIDAAIADDADGRRMPAAAIWKRFDLERFNVAPRTFSAYVTLLRKRRNNAPVSNLVKAMADGRSYTLDDVEAIAMGKLVAALDGGKLKLYEITGVITAINGTQKARIAEAVEERRSVDWQEQRRKAEVAADKIEATLKGKRISRETVDEIRRTVFGIVD